MWPLTSPRADRISGPEKFCSSARKDFFNSIGAMLMLGLLTRPVAFVLSGEMAFAYFLGHFPKGFLPLLNGGTLAIMFCFACLYLAAAGAGPLSLDGLLRAEPSPRPDERGFGRGFGHARR
jgi:hypothetical protein